MSSRLDEKVLARQLGINPDGLRKDELEGLAVQIAEPPDDKNLRQQREAYAYLLKRCRALASEVPNFLTFPELEDFYRRTVDEQLARKGLGPGAVVHFRRTYRDIKGGSEATILVLRTVGSSTEFYSILNFGSHRLTVYPELLLSSGVEVVKAPRQ